MRRLSRVGQVLAEILAETWISLACFALEFGWACLVPAPRVSIVFAAFIAGFFFTIAFAQGWRALKRIRTRRQLERQMARMYAGRVMMDALDRRGWL